MGFSVDNGDRCFAGGGPSDDRRGQRGQAKGGNGDEKVRSEWMEVGAGGARPANERRMWARRLEGTAVSGR